MSINGPSGMLPSQPQPASSGGEQSGVRKLTPKAKLILQQVIDGKKDISELKGLVFQEGCIASVKKSLNK